MGRQFVHFGVMFQVGGEKKVKKCAYTPTHPPLLLVGRIDGLGFNRDDGGGRVCRGTRSCVRAVGF